MVFHGGPGLDHTMFGDYLDLLTDEYSLVLVDERGQGRSAPSDRSTWTLEQMAEDVGRLAAAMGFERYATLGHSFGALVVLQHAVSYPGEAAATIVSSGIPSAEYLERVQAELERFEPVELREQVAGSWAREAVVETIEEFEQLLHDQQPFHFKDPRDPRIEEYESRTGGGLYSPDVIRHFASRHYGTIDVVDRLGEVTHPVLVLAGRHDRTTCLEGGEAIARGIPNAELVVFEDSAHMTFVEENDAYVAAVRDFLGRVAAG
jgi:proline iminopeptidase